MPHDVTMPQLGMAQETGVIVAWHKQPGEPVAQGDVLFEVETDKATMEVEAQGKGYLAGVTAHPGDEVPVGQIIARIADSAEQEADDTTAPEPTDDALPEGRAVIMPTLGMAQDSGVLVGWLVDPGGVVRADAPLFEVETDKSVMEVPAGVDGYLAAQLAGPGDDVPTGQVIAIVSAEAPANPVVRGLNAQTAPAAEPPADTPAAPKPAPQKAPETPAAPVPTGGHILASPKARRLALEQGLDLSRLAEAGHPQPYHVRDLDVLRALPAPVAPTAAAIAPAARHLTAEVAGDGFAGFAAWAAGHADLSDAQALLAGLAGASLGRARAVVAIEAHGRTRRFDVPPGPLRAVRETDDAVPALVIRDLRDSPVRTVRMGAEAVPALSIMRAGDGLSLTLECATDRMSASEALSLLSEFAGRMEHPLRHLL